ncbi:unnamed protein product [Nippostrongylus brasiliensis]|uniref:Cell division protein FtsZ n=1 Tax=Nippostrongylus brasiliensis TaxID=27835 RepID=A0A0N4XMW1_NIPBR|nr:unnamed protein product [Nippostrongylus brasiliensis]
MPIYQPGPAGGGGSPMMPAGGAIAPRIGGVMPMPGPGGPIMAQRAVPMGVGSSSRPMDRHGFDEYDDVDMGHGYDRGHYRY